MANAIEVWCGARHKGRVTSKVGRNLCMTGYAQQVQSHELGCLSQCALHRRSEYLGNGSGSTRVDVRAKTETSSTCASLAGASSWCPRSPYVLIVPTVKSHTDPIRHKPRALEQCARQDSRRRVRVRPNPSIERTRSGSAGLALISFWAKPAPPPRAAHVKR